MRFDFILPLTSKGPKAKCFNNRNTPTAVLRLGETLLKEEDVGV